MQRIRSVTFILVCMLMTAPHAGEDRIAIRVGGVTAWVEVAVSDHARRQGLMYRQALAKDQGMLLVFPREQPVQIWMLNVPIPLDVGFFDDQGILLNWLTMQPDGGREIHRSSAPARYALEMNAGWFRRNGLVSGARLELPMSIEAAPDDYKQKR